MSFKNFGQFMGCKATAHYKYQMIVLRNDCNQCKLITFSKLGSETLSPVWKSFSNAKSYV